jgi:hypothetical protein
MTAFALAALAVTVLVLARIGTEHRRADRRYLTGLHEEALIENYWRWVKSIPGEQVLAERVSIIPLQQKVRRLEAQLARGRR